MKVETNHAVQTNIGNAVKFSVSENASKLFAMLGHHLYSNKEEAVLHEISANAVDAHKMVGKESTPILVIMPTNLDSQIRIRDYGPGLSEDNVYRFLTTFGESNKQESNELIGGWGIGSKSPAAVTDTWKITSYHGGLQSEYLVFINGDGIPSLTKIRSVETEESGLEVAIPVQTSRQYSWNQAVANVYSYYPVEPTFKNHPGVKSKYPQKKDGPFFWRENGIGKLSIISSNRRYALDTSKLTQEFSGDKILTAMLIMSYNIEMDIGEVELSISREQLQYTKKTVTAIGNKLRIIFDHIKTKFDAFVSSHADELDYREKIISFLDKEFSQGYHGFNQVAVMPILVGGKYGIVDSSSLKVIKFGHKLSPLQIAELDYRVTNGRATKNVTSNFTCWKTFFVNAASTYDRTSGSHFYDVSISIPNLNRIKFYEADITNAYARINYAHPDVYCFVVKKADDLPEILRKRVIKASSLPVPPKKARLSGASLVQNDFSYKVEGGKFVRVPNTSLQNFSKLAYVVTPDFISSSHVLTNQNKFLQEQFGYTLIGVKSASSIPKGKGVEDCMCFEYDAILTSNEFKDNIEKTCTNKLRMYQQLSMVLRSLDMPDSKLYSAFKKKYATIIAKSLYGQNSNFNSVENAKRLAGFLNKTFTLDYIDEFEKDLTEIRNKYKIVEYFNIHSTIDFNVVKEVLTFIEK